MMRLIFGVVLVVGVGLAGYAVHIAKQEFTKYQDALAAQQSAIVPVREVFVVKRQLRYGDQLRRSDVRAIAWPANAVPAGAFTSLDQIFPPDKPEPRTILRVMERDEPLLIMKVTAPGEDAGVSASLGTGMRAFALRVDVMSGVSGFLRPGDRVDVYWTGTGEQGGVTRLIHANLNLIAIDQVTDEQRNNPMIARTVTVEAAPDQVAKLAQAQATGSLTLALVGVRDDTESESVQATRDEVLGTQADEQARVCTIRTRKGSEVVLIPIPCSDS